MSKMFVYIALRPETPIKYEFDLKSYYAKNNFRYKIALNEVGGDGHIEMYYRDFVNLCKDHPECYWVEVDDIRFDLG